MFDIPVRIDNLLSPAQPASVNNAGMVQLIAENYITLSRESRYAAHICLVAGIEGKCCLGLFKARNCLFEL